MSEIGTVQIGDRIIGPGHPVFIIADIGLTNGGDLERTFNLIDIAKDLGVDAIKFQMIGPEYLLGDREITYTYPTLNDGPKTENMFEMFSSLSYSSAEWKKIANAVQDAGLEFICTSHYVGAVDILEECNVACHKICTWSVTHKRLIQKIGRTRKPMLMDLGASTEHSLLKLIDWFVSSGGDEIIPLHDFHTTVLSEMNFRNIKRLKQIFSSPVGFTSADEKTSQDFMAMGMDIDIIEKRLTLDKTIPENGHWKSMEPDEFHQWVKTIKELEIALGSSTIKPSQGDREISRWAFKSLFAIEDIKKGSIIDDHMIDGRRPGSGISVKNVDSVIGRLATNDIPKDTMLSWEMLS